MSDFDGLRLCTRCRDRETTSEHGICHVCREQDMIDDYDFDEWVLVGEEMLICSCRFCHCMNYVDAPGDVCGNCHYGEHQG